MARNDRSTNGGRGRGNGRNANPPRSNATSNGRSGPNNSTNTPFNNIPGPGPLARAPARAPAPAFSWATVAAGGASASTAPPNQPLVPQIIATTTPDIDSTSKTNPAPGLNTADSPNPCDDASVENDVESSDNLPTKSPMGARTINPRSLPARPRDSRRNYSIPPTVVGPSNNARYDQAPLPRGADKAIATIKAKLDALKFANAPQGANKHVSKSQEPPRPAQNRGPAKKDKWTKLDLRAGGEAKQKAVGTKTEFKNLPPELRTKIWGHAMDVPRLIEIEYGPATRNGVTLIGYIMCGSHGWRRVSPSSRKPPAVFHVCFESRKEALRVYQKRTFDTKSQDAEIEKYIYFNPRADILYFGENTCVSTLMHVFNPKNLEDIPRIAIQCSGRITMCCDWDDSTYGIDGGVTPMQALHGMEHEPTSLYHGWGGCPGLKEVFWVIPSHLWEPAPGKLDPDAMSFRAPSTTGITKGQKRFYEGLQGQIQQVENDHGLWGVGPNLWVDEDKPTFEFVSLAPHAKTKSLTSDGLVHEAMEVTKAQHQFLGKKYAALVKELEYQSGCDILLSKWDYAGEGREVGFSGSKEAVVRARALVEDELEKFEKRNNRV